jgi:hypothetical protein
MRKPALLALAIAFLATTATAVAAGDSVLPELQHGETTILSRHDRSALAAFPGDDPVIRLVETGGGVAGVRLTPLDGRGAAVGGGRLVMLGANETRVVRLRDEFATDALHHTTLRVEVLHGSGRVLIASSDEYGRPLQPRADESPSRRRSVSRGAPPLPRSRTLIDAAEKAGAIDAETALLYRVYAIFEDSRLPQQYRGDDRDVTEGMYLAEVVEQYPRLSPATRAAVMPFLIPPAYKNSWAQNEQAVPAIAGDTPPLCSDLSSIWESVLTKNEKVRVWFKRGSGDLPRAEELAVYINDKIWPKLTGLMKNHVPKPDGEIKNCNSGDDALDFYLTDIVRSNAVPLGGGCQNVPAFIEMNRTRTNATVIHEIMHAFQFSYPLAACMTDAKYNWWTEGSATWAQDFVDPAELNKEHEVAERLLGQPQQPLDLANDHHEYATYLLPFFVARYNNDTNFVSATWEACQKQPALEAFDSSVSGGFEKVWFDFVRHNWNRQGFDQYFKWDKLFEQAAVQGGKPAQATVSGGDNADPIKVDLPRLSATYKHYAFDDESVSSVAFWNGLNFDLKLHEIPLAGVQYDPHPGDEARTRGARVQALIKINNKWTTQDWSKRPFVTFCRDLRAERLQELVIIFSNSEFKERDRILDTGGGGLPVLFTSNIGCWQWKGTARHTLQQEYLSSTTSATVTWTREGGPETIPQVQYVAEGTAAWSVNFIPPGPAKGCNASGTVPIRGFYTLKTYNYVPIQGSFHRSYHGAGTETSPYTNCGAGPIQAPWLMNPLQPFIPGIPESRWLHVSADGKTMEGTYTTMTAPGSTWTWKFRAEKE